MLGTERLEVGFCAFFLFWSLKLRFPAFSERTRKFQRQDTKQKEGTKSNFQFAGGAFTILASLLAIGYTPYPSPNKNPRNAEVFDRSRKRNYARFFFGAAFFFAFFAAIVVKFF
jgi:hypothetical protein